VPNKNDVIVSLLRDLIIEHNRVSLPCLGSFLSEYEPACFVDGKIHPPSKSIVFRQNEIWNDEKLEKSLSQHLNESIGVAKEETAFWVDDICVLLATGEMAVLEGLGKLYISKQSKLIFEQMSENLLLDSFGLEPVDISASGKKHDSPFRNGKRQKVDKPLMWGTFAIVATVILAIYLIFTHILTDKSSISLFGKTENVETKTSKKQRTVEEYHVPKYGIIIKSFEKYSDASDFSKNCGYSTSIICYDAEKPYAVVIACYPDETGAKQALDTLKNNSLFSSAKIVKLVNN
jgi:hypothetical protein